MSGVQRFHSMMSKRTIRVVLRQSGILVLRNLEADARTVLLVSGLANAPLDVPTIKKQSKVQCINGVPVYRHPVLLIILLLNGIIL